MGNLRDNVIRLAHEKPELQATLLPLLTATVVESGGKLGRGDRRRINTKLGRASSPPYYRSFSSGLAVMLKIIYDDIGLTPLHNIGRPHIDSGQQSYQLGMTRHGTDVLLEVENSMLVLQWHKMESGNHEITAYLS